MKKLLLVICIGLYTGKLFAQIAPSPPAHVVTNTPDSIAIKATKIPASALKITSGTSMMAANNIADNISRSPNLSRFFSAIQSAGLNETFKSKGPITVFAPDNQAFEKLSAGKLDSLLRPQGKYDLIALLTYHAIAGRITAKDIAKQINSKTGVATFITLAGSKLTAKIDANRNIILIDEMGRQSTVTKFDIPQNNGLIHIVSSVLIPKIKNI